MEITLKKNGWHKRLQVYVFRDSAPTFYNFCPYFWITNFCILVTFIIPVVPLARLLIMVVGGTGYFIGKGIEKFGEWFERAICEPMFEKSALKMGEEDLLRADVRFKNYYGDADWEDYDFWHKQYFKNGSVISYRKADAVKKKFEIWKAKNPDYKKIISDIKEKRRKEYLDNQAEHARKYKKRMEAEEARTLRRAGSRERKQKMFISIIKYTKWLAIAAGVVLVAWIGSLLYHFGVYCYDHFYMSKFITVMKYTGVILGSAIVVLGIGFFIFKISQNITCSFSCNCNFLGKIFRPIGKAIVWFFTHLANFVGRVWETLVILKKDYCPGILFVDDKEEKN